MEDSYTCNGAPSICTHKCGNSLRDPEGSYSEACDDGNNVNNDGCTSNCEVEDPYTCVGGSPSSVDTCYHRCGNGAVDPTGSYTEECDDNNLISLDGCSSTCKIEDDFTCDNSGSGSICTKRCGNGAFDPFGTHNEDCDDANDSNGDGCSADCVVEHGYACSRTGVSSATPDTCVLLCGNSNIDSSEACDDGALLAGDGCSTTCLVETGYECTNEPGRASVCTAICGDAIVIGEEECDTAVVMNVTN